jgi:hypothetical protein
MLTYITFAIVAMTSVWAGVDAHRNKIPSGKKPYSGSNAVSWFLCCLLLWIISFPVYLFKRAKTLKERKEASSTSITISLLGTLSIVAVLLCIAAPFLGWQRLSVDELRDRVSTSIQSTWHNNPATQNIRLKSLSLVHKNGNEYGGLVVADVSGNEEQHTVDVTYDGKTFIWEVR